MKMASYRIGVLYGDGIGPEITKSAVERYWSLLHANWE